jgi:cytochrome b
MDNRMKDGRLVWDLPVRVTHWLLVLAVVGAWTTNKLGPSWFTWHLVCGCTVLVLVSFRLIWGFVGTRYARFSSFLRGPRTVLAYLRGHASGVPLPDPIGHNPLGGLSVLVLLTLLLAQALTGLFSNDDIANAGPFYGWVSEARSGQLTSVHHRVFLLLEIFIGLHLLAVLFYTFIKRVRLIAPMISGYKPAQLVPAGREISGSRLWAAVLLLLALTAALLWLIHRAPPVEFSAF